MNFLTLDFETYYDRQYSLKKMTPAEYIMSPAFETICMSYKLNDAPAVVVDGPDVATVLAQFPAHDTTTLAYNALFDNCILAWRYGYVPALMIDGLGMSRALLGHVMRRLNLGGVVEHLGLPAKQSQVLQSVMGMHRLDIMANESLWQSFLQYSRDDSELLYAVFNKLAPDFPTSEYPVMDLVLRCAVQPRLQVDVPLLQAHHAEVVAEKDALLARVGVERDANGKAPALSSAVQFQKMLEDFGVEVEYKTSLTGNAVPALAKTDSFMASLQEHPDLQVQALAAARLGIKSTIEETRTLRFIQVASLWADHPLPIPLRYGAAHTHRLGGDWKMNAQNLPSGRDGRPTKLRKSIKAPEGHKVLVGDLKQVEARTTATVCHADTLLAAFRKGDPYAVMGSQIFGYPLTDPKGAHALERFIGKEAVLGLGYGMGEDKFYDNVLKKLRGLNMDPEKAALWTPALAKKATTTYRRANKQIVASWRILDRALKGPWAGIGPLVRFGPCIIGHGYVEAPGGLRMLYDVPLHKKPGDDIYFSYGGIPSKIYGAHFLENIIQFLTRNIQMHAAVRLAKRGIVMCHMVHDELIFVVRDDQVDMVKQIVIEEMRRPPPWLLDVPLDVDIGIAQTYGDAK
jgi:DNA polymerase family A